MQNYKCKKCQLIYKKNGFIQNLLKKFYSDYQSTHPGGLNTPKKNFGKKKFLILMKDYKYSFNKKKL